MRRNAPFYGLLAEFETPESLLDAARKARRQGYRRLDAYSPFSIEGLAEAVGFRFNILPWLMFFGGIFGAGGGYFMQWYGMAVSYPINVGGRPLNSWPSYIPITFELGVLSASLVGFFAMLALNGLPKPYHPVFTAPRFSLATSDRFFLCIQADDPHFDTARTRQFLEGLRPRGVVDVEG